MEGGGKEGKGESGGEGVEKKGTEGRCDEITIDGAKGAPDQ